MAGAGLAVFAAFFASCVSCTSVDASFAAGRLTDEDVNYLVGETAGALFKAKERFVIPGKRRVALVKEIVVDAVDRSTGVGRQVTEKLKDELQNSGWFLILDPQAAALGKSIAPEFVFSGRIVQRTIRQGDGKQLVRYDMEICCSNAESGLEFWNKKLTIAKIVED